MTQDVGARRGVVRSPVRVVAPTSVKRGRLIRIVRAAGPFPITMGAQAHLAGWYARFGFRTSGPGYVEDGIPHVPMRRERA